MRSNRQKSIYGERKKLKKRTIAITVALLAFLLAGSAFAANTATDPLVPNAAYTITISKLSSVGQLVDIETVGGTTDNNGLLSFTLTRIPTKDEANFIFLTIKDGSGTVVRRGMAPAPPLNDNNATGLNYLSTTQADGMLLAASTIGTDDPIVAAYLLIILRSPGISTADLTNLAGMGQDALTNPTLGFESFLLSNGVTQAALDKLKGCLIYNPDNSAKTLRNFTRNFFDAVAATDNAAASSAMQKAGGFMAEVFLDAGTCAGIGAGKILAAHNAAGDGAQAGVHMSALSAGLLGSINTAMSSFDRRIAIVRISKEYTNALNALNASGAQVTQYLASVTGLMNASALVDAQFSEYFMNRTAYLAAHPGVTDNDVQTDMNAAYSAGWTQFQTNIAADNASITTMKNSLLAANDNLMLPPDFGTYMDQTGTQKNWPIPQVVLMNWLAASTFNYSARDNTAIPSMMGAWMGVCDNNMFWDQGSCVGNGYTWTPGRRDYVGFTGFPVFDSYLGLQEDLNIIQMKRNEIWMTGTQPTGAERAANENLYVTRVLSCGARITGSKSGNAITAAEKDAILKLLLPPQM
jgi:hypothetical protein